MRAVIFANGTLPDKQAMQTTIESADLLIAADGGALHCLAMGLTPHVVVGDFDSLSPKQEALLRAGGAHFVVHPRMKDQTDLELAIKYAIDTGADNINLLGLLGGRLDQTIANLLLISRQDWDPAKLTLTNGYDVAHLISPGDTLAVHGITGDVVSLIPLSSTVSGITTNGLRWSLHKASLSLGSTLGVSNELCNQTANIQIEEGKLLVVHRNQNVQE
jgi:thiamine pyrophosphokinase